MATASQAPRTKQEQQQQQQRREQERRNTLRFIINEFNDYGHRTTVHGLGHMYQSTDTCRKLFWLCITLVSCGACAVHIYFIVANYMETPVNSVILQGRIRQEFPDVTFCNMYPISESVQYHAAKEIHGHISNRWKYFSGFIRAGNFSANDKVGRLKVARTFMQIFWASEDTRDLAHDDDLFIVQCSYKNRQCSNKQFKMVQNLRYWNCYTFAPKFDGGHEDRQVYSSNEDEGLSLILYTNSHLRNVHPKNGLTTIRDVYYDYEDEILNHLGDQSNFLERYLENYNLSLNQLLAGDKLEPDGMRVILHEKDTYPHMDMNSVIVGNGDFSNINFYMERKLSKNRPEHPCRVETSGTEDRMEYMAYYPGSNIRYPGPRPPPNFKKFKRARLDYIVDKSQALFWSACHCYTHIMPFQCFNTELCYHCRDGTDPAEIERTLRHIWCHDRVYEHRLKHKIFDYFRDSQNFQPCSVNNYNVKMGSSAWPSQRDIQFLINQYVLPAFQKETVGARSYNHILKNTSVAPIHDIISQESSTTAAEFLVARTSNWTAARGVTVRRGLAESVNSVLL
ncbi:hypothetical protein BOX15_Mlig031565g1 [Macrostomum lignano]|uniref:Amiloride-sensitive sodium channel n=1 Tax=Macrostomum lignano TaxID=282301 RepID=A0A267F1T7_9PLAT|nr:hypothetical protein BOX15_Mlig031565g1 [Macrostomum lignano]